MSPPNTLKIHCEPLFFSPVSGLSDRFTGVKESVISVFSPSLEGCSLETKRFVFLDSLLLFDAFLNNLEISFHTEVIFI